MCSYVRISGLKVLVVRWPYRLKLRMDMDILVFPVKHCHGAVETIKTEIHVLNLLTFLVTITIEADSKLFIILEQGYVKDFFI